MIENSVFCDFFTRCGSNEVERFAELSIMPTWVEKLIGLLLAIVAVVWAVYHVASVHEFQGGFLHLGPMQILMAGLMVWLHGKYRAVHFTRVRREYLFGHSRSDQS